MREILFRGKRIDGDEWVEGYFFYKNDVSLQRLSKSFIIKQNKSGYLLWIEVDPTTVGQYTGLTDKNGVKIFEGDIVKWCRKDIVLCGHYTHGFRGYKYGDKLIVRRLESGFVLCGKNDDMPDFPSANEKVDNYAFWNYQGFLEVIGNICDNPELLEGVV